MSFADRWFAGDGPDEPVEAKRHGGLGNPYEKEADEPAKVGTVTATECGNCGRRMVIDTPQGGRACPVCFIGS